MGIDIRPLRMPLVKRALRGLRRDDKPKSTPKLPVTVAILSPRPRHRLHSLRAMMTLATYGLFYGTLECREGRDYLDNTTSRPS